MLSSIIFAILAIVYLIVGVVLYANDYFDDDEADVTKAVTFALIGGTVFALRVFRLSTSVLSQELEIAAPGLIDFVKLKAIAAWGLLIAGLVAIWVFLKTFPSRI